MEEPLGTYYYGATFRRVRILSRRLARKIFFWPIREVVHQGDSVAFLHEMFFFFHSSWLLWLIGVSKGSLSQKDSRRPRKPQAVLRKQHSLIDFWDVAYYFSSIIEQLLKLSTMRKTPLYDLYGPCNAGTIGQLQSTLPQRAKRAAKILLPET